MAQNSRAITTVCQSHHVFSFDTIHLNYAILLAIFLIHTQMPYFATLLSYPSHAIML